ncbi:hypothetical protein QUF95_17435 [Paenibacillus silvae]|nr:hypothetical protein [Paenibacillus silvae]
MSRVNRCEEIREELKHFEKLEEKHRIKKRIAKKKMLILVIERYVDNEKRIYKPI